MSAKKSKGSELERMVRAILKDLQSRRLCYLWKLPTDLRLTRDGLMPGDPMPADFMGWRNDGQCVLIECKDVDKNTLRLGGPPGLSPFQLAACHFARTNGVPYLVVWKRKDQFLIVVPRTDGAKSMEWVDEIAMPLERLPILLPKAIMH